MNARKQNEQKLLKNLDQIVARYIKVNDKLLESIASEDDKAFKEQVILSSSDHFLDGIVDVYEEFTDALKNKLSDLHKPEITDIKQKKLRDFTTIKKKKLKVQPTTGKKRGKYVSKGKRVKWNTKEKKILERSVKADLKPKRTLELINNERTKEGLPLRNYSSIKNKYYRIKTKVNN